MSDTRTYRGSEAPLAMLCPGAVNPEPKELLIDSVNPAGAVGTVVHSICETLVKYGTILPDWEGTCAGFGLDAAQTKEVGSLIYAAKAFWDANKEAFPNAETEVELVHDYSFYGARLSGHVDILAQKDRAMFVVDWKTTRLDIDYTPQMLFYAWLCHLINFQCDTVTTAVVYLRDRTANIKVWDRDATGDFAGRYQREVLDWDGQTYRPGGHCSYCKRFANCPALREMALSTVRSLDVCPKPDIIERADLVGFYGRVQAVEAMTKKARDYIRAAVEQAGGELPGLKLVPSSRDTIDAKKAWPVLTARMESDEFADAVEIKKGPLMEIAANLAPRGKKKEAKADLMEALKAAGAVTTTEFKTLRVVQSKETEVQIVGISETE